MKTMKMKIIKIAAASAAFVLLLGTPLFSQSVDSLVNEAVRNNPRLKSYQHKIRSAEYRAESAGYLPAPSLGIEFSEVPFGKYNLFNDALSNSISLSQMFMLGGKLGAMQEVERKNALIKADDYESYKVSLTGQIKMSYYTLWLAERKKEIQDKTLGLYNDLLNSMSVLYTVNKVPQADLIILKTEIASLKTQLLALGRDRDAEVYKLNRFLGRDLNSNDYKTDSMLSNDSVNVSYAELEDVLIKSNPQLKQMDNMADMNKTMIAANEKERIPDLMVQGMVMRQPQGMVLTTKSDLSMLSMGMAEPGKTEYMYSLMASVTLPFVPWASGRINAKEEELVSGIRGIESEKSDMQREMLAQLKTSLNKLKSSEDLIKLYSAEVIPMYEQAIRSQVSAYQNNQTTISTVIDSFRMHLMNEMNYYMALADRQMALAEIEMMTGKELKKGE